MHEIQQQLLALSDTEDLGQYSYYALAKKLGVPNHGSVKFHLDQLLQKGMLIKNVRTGEITKVEAGSSFSGFINIPIMGEANCGDATSIADNRVIDFLKVSPSILPKVRLDKLYALLAKGDSMNAANINGSSINDGDYVLIENTNNARDGDYVVSVFDEVANIKRFFIDAFNSRIILASESKEPRHPIIVAQEDFSNYLVTGKVVGVIPSVNNAVQRG